MLSTLGHIYQFFVWYLIPVTTFVAYIYYVKKFSFFRWVETQNDDSIKNKIPRGKCPPSYPWGWYRLCRSPELKSGQVSEIKLCGRHIAYYRGEDGIVYAVSAYCLHMGANLGHGGKVKFGRCIECPFHGWTFDGKTGKCVHPESYDPKIVNNFRYLDITTLTKNIDGKYIEECGQSEAKLDTYIVKEQKGIIYVWIHPDPNQKPIYDIMPVDISHLSLRAESVNYVHCHIQEIPENGADMKHFDYIHYTALNFLYPFIKLEWKMKTKNAADSDFWEVMQHPSIKYRQHQNNLYEQHLKDKSNLKYINVLSIDGYIIVMNRWKFHGMVATGFQMGSATVQLCVKSMFFEAMFFQSIQPLDKFYQRVYHTLWTNGHLPYWASAFILYQELRQVLFDVSIWNQKIFSDKLRYNMKSEADRCLLSWREWYSQFYVGCADKKETLEW